MSLLNKNYGKASAGVASMSFLVALAILLAASYIPHFLTAEAYLFFVLLGSFVAQGTAFVLGIIGVVRAQGRFYGFVGMFISALILSSVIQFITACGC